MRAKKSLNNTLMGFLAKFTAIGCGLILPYLILNTFGSSYNGMTNSIIQFLHVVYLLNAGIGVVATASLYKPLAENDIESVSAVVKTAESFLRKVALVFLGIALLMAGVFPLLVLDEFNYFYSASLVLIISISTFTHYFFGLAYQTVLTADQKQSFIYIAETAKTVVNTLVGVIIINLGFGIHAVMAGTAVVFSAPPVITHMYVRKKYKININAKKNNELIKQRWDNFAIHTAAFISNNIGLIIITIFTNLYEVSVFVVYRMIIFGGIATLMSPFELGIQSAFGDMLAKKEYKRIIAGLRTYEQVVFVSATFLFGVTAATILPFISIYTANIVDADYIRPIFAYFFILAIFAKVIFIPYVGIANAAGHFSQLRKPAYIEAAMCLILSVVMVYAMGILGAVIAVGIAYGFRTVRYAVYTSHILVPRSIWLFIKRAALSLISIAVIVFLSKLIHYDPSPTFFHWALYAGVVSVIAGVMLILSEWLFYREDTLNLISLLVRMRRKARKQSESFDC